MIVPSRGSDQFPLRLPSGLRDKIKIVAEQNCRSMNSEIVYVLEQHYRRFQETLVAGDVSLENSSRHQTETVALQGDNS